jgi:hypothetical protein
MNTYPHFLLPISPVPPIALDSDIPWKSVAITVAIASFVGSELASFTAIQESPFVIVAAFFLISSGASIVNYLRAM